jgi:hypothetical protein
MAATADFSQFQKKLSKDQQILHALDRLTFGPRPGDVEAVKAAAGPGAPTTAGSWAGSNSATCAVLPSDRRCTRIEVRACRVASSAHSGSPPGWPAAQ